MSDEFHDVHGEPYRNAIAGSDCLNRPPRNREAAALDLARSALRAIAVPSVVADLAPIVQRLADQHLARRALDDISAILGEGPKS